MTKPFNIDDELRRAFRAAAGLFSPGDNRCTWGDADTKQDSGQESLDLHKRKARSPAKFVIRVVRLAHVEFDEDNLCSKVHIDGLRYAGIIPGDAPHEARIETTQEVIPLHEKERVRIDIFKRDDL